MPLLRSSILLFVRVYPGFHIGLCPHSTLGFAGVPPLQGSFHSFICVYPGFHIGLCPHSTLGFAGVSPLQGSLSYWAFAVLCCVVVLCSLNVFGCVNGLLRSVEYLFDCDCIVCGIGGIDWCSRAMSPLGRYSCKAQGASPGFGGLKHILSPFRGGTNDAYWVWLLCCIVFIRWGIGLRR